MKYTLLLLSLLTLSFISCKEEDEDQGAIDQQRILDHAKENNLTLLSHESGIYYKIEKAGTGTARPNAQSTITVKYTGKLLNGEIFDSSNNQPFTFQLNNVIQGWKIGIPLMQRGERTTFFIPSELGYGAQGSGSIPGNSVLIFEIELLNF